MTPVIRGALLMVISAVSVAVDTIIIRAVSVDIHPFEIGFFRNFFGLLVLAPWLMRSGLKGLASPRMPLHLARAVLKLTGMICFFYAVAVLPLAVVTAVAFTTPLFASLGSMVILREPAYFRRIAALAVGLIGVVIVVRPGGSAFDSAILIAVAAAVSLGGVVLMMKYLSMRESPPAVVTLNLLMTVPLALVVALPVWVTPAPEILALMLVQGLLGGISQLSVSRAMSLADASFLVPIEFLRLPLVALLAWMAFGEAVDLWTIVGGAVIFAGTVVLVGRESRSPSTAGTSVPPGNGKDPF